MDFREMRSLVSLAVFVVGAAVQASCAEVEPSLLSGEWKLTAFDGYTTNDVAVERSDRAWSLRLLTDPKPGGRQKRAWSMTHRLPPFERDGVLKLTFEGRCRNAAKVPAYSFCATTGGPGMLHPFRRYPLTLTPKWKRHEFSLSMTDVLPTCVLEILWEGDWKAGDGIDIRDIRLVADESQAVTLDVLQPRNLLLSPETTNRMVCGYAHLPGRFQGGYWRVDLVSQTSGKVVRSASGSIASRRVDWCLEASDIADGCYGIQLTARTATGVCAPMKQRPLLVGKPAPGAFVVRNGRVERDGKPFFPVILDHCAGWNIDFVNRTGRDIGDERLTMDAAYRDIAAHGFNTLNGMVDDFAGFARDAKQYGLMVMPQLRHERPEIDNVVGWYGKDEPANELDRQNGRDYYAFAKHGVRQDVVYSAMYHVKALEYNATEGAYCDVFMYDDYPIRTARSDFRALSAQLAELAKMARRIGDVAFGFVPQAFVYCGLEPTPAQLRAETYLAIAHGARALDYYAYTENFVQDFTSKKEKGLPTPTGQSRNPKRRHWWLRESDLWDEIGILNGEFARLQDYIFSDDADMTIRSVHTNVFLSARMVGSRARLIAVNLTPDPVVASILSVRLRTFKGVFSSAELRLEAGETSVPFAPYEVKVFEEADPAEVPDLPGESPAVSLAPFPDRLSAYVWRNWFVVPHDRLARTVGATEDELEEVAAEMGLPRRVDVSSRWRREGCVTVLRRNWHLLDYPQLLMVLDMSRQELQVALKEGDFLWHKLGNVKPTCGSLVFNSATVQSESARRARRCLAKILDEEDVRATDSEEPRFAFVDTLANADPTFSCPVRGPSPFDFRMIFSYFAEYGDPLSDPDIASYPEGLLQKLAAQGVTAVWLHTVLSRLAKDERYPEFGDGCERRLENLRKLVARAATCGIGVYLYLNEPRAQPASFFEARPERKLQKGAKHPRDELFARCTSDPETLRWMRDSVKKVFSSVPGLKGVFTISMSENMAHCNSHGGKDRCERCEKRSSAEIIAEVNRAIVEGMCAGSPNAEAIVWNWSWPEADEAEVLATLPKDRCRVMAVSEGRMDICRGGIQSKTHDYSISVVGPGERAKAFWRRARANGLIPLAKVQANTTWELSTVPYLPTMDLVAEHAANLVKEGVKGVLLSWSLGSAPSPNLRVYDVMDDRADVNATLDRIAEECYGTEAVAAVRRAWTAFSVGFTNFPFSIPTVYYGPQQWGPANPLYEQKTGWTATMVGFPYDDIETWIWPYPPEVWVSLMEKVAEGFCRGCDLWKLAMKTMLDDAKRREAEREYGLFKTAMLHFASSADQVRFVLCRRANDRNGQRAVVLRELARAKEELSYVRADSRIGYESTNHYLFIPQDLREKVLLCRQLHHSLRQNP